MSGCDRAITAARSAVMTPVHATTASGETVGPPPAAESESGPSAPIGGVDPAAKTGYIRATR